MPAASTPAIPLESLARRIYLIRGQKVMLDSDLAEIYQIETSNLNKAVKRNIERFPDDFMMQLTSEEAANLTFQFGISSWGGRRTLPYAFTEHGVAMLASVLRRPRAIAVNILIVRAFIQLRELLATHKDLAARLDSLESHQRRHASVINLLATEIEQLKTPPSPPPPPPKHPIGFPRAQRR
ncbi:MAG: ORF6N domain-containing protein [Bryobacterales bacterium]|nr:ORF6N domain-containing protein [Bryobacterales bacterium]